MRILIHDRNSGASTKMTLSQFPCTVGRADTCQIHLPYDSISAQHAVIEKKNGTFFIRDLESRNGIVCEGNSLPSVALSAHTLVSLGKIDIEILEISASEIEQTKPIQFSGPQSTKPLTLSLVILAIVPAITWQKSHFLGATSLSLGLVTAFTMIALTFGFSAFSAWTSSFFDSRYQFKRTFPELLWLNSLFMSCHFLISAVNPYIAFNLDDAEKWSLIRLPMTLLPTGLFLYFYCKRVFFSGKRKNMAVAGSVLATFAVVIFFSNFIFSSRLESLNGAITVPFRNFSQENRSLADFDAQFKSVLEKVEVKRAEAYAKMQASEAEQSK